MVVYLARQQVLNLNKASAIWPKELQLITRQTDREVSRLASAYKKQSKQRHEPFHEDSSAGHHSGVPKVSLVVDLTDGRSSAVEERLQDPSLVSPRASLKKDHLISSEKKQTAEKDKIPVASIVVPGGRRAGNSNSGLKNFQLSSQKALGTNSGLKKYPENTRPMAGLKSKAKNILQPKANGAKAAMSGQCDRKHSSKEQSSHKDAQVRHFISAQKSDDGKVKLFAERRVSQTNNIIDADHVGSLRVKNLDTQKSVADAKSLGLGKLVTHKSTRSLANGLRINAGRPEILSRPDSVQSHSAKNQNATYASNSSGQFKNRLQSKYGISAHNKMFANGSQQPSSTKNSESKRQYMNNGIRVNHSRNKVTLRTGEGGSNSKYANPYILQRNGVASKHLQSEAELHVSRGSFNQGTKKRFRDCSEHAALQSRDFKSVGCNLPVVNQSLRINRRVSDSGTFHPVINSHEQLEGKLKAPLASGSQPAEDTSSQQQLVRDIREATTVKEVRDIMNQVKSKYRNPYNTKGAASQQASGVHDLRI